MEVMGFILGLVVGFVASMCLGLQEAVGIISVITGLIGFAVGMVLTNISLSNEQQNVKNVLSYDSKTNTLTVSGRHPSLEKLLKVEDFMVTKADYTQEKLVFTAVSSGGFTTGGVHKEGGLHTQKASSGKYYISYKMRPEWSMPVHMIKLSEELAAAAKSTASINRYLTDSTFIIVGKNNISEAAYINAGSYAMNMPTEGAGIAVGYNLMANAEAQKYSTFEKCKSIIDWLSDV